MIARSIALFMVTAVGASHRRYSSRFDPFQRLDRTRVDDHHGLGLSIVRAIVHDTTLTAHARPQGGLSIEIHFPLIPFAMPR